MPTVGLLLFAVQEMAPGVIREAAMFTGGNSAIGDCTAVSNSESQNYPGGAAIADKLFCTLCLR